MDRLRNNTAVRYVVVGGLAYVVEMGVLFVLSTTFGVSSVMAVAISFWIGFVVAFVLQKFVAFQHHDTRPKVVARQLALYSTLVAWNYVFTLAVAQIFANFASIFVLRTIVILVVTLWNFAVYRLVFKERGEGGHKQDA